MDLYFTRHDGEAATVEQFVQCFADAAGTDFRQFMLWYSQAGTPEVVATGSHDPRAKTYRLELAQTVPPTPGQPTKEPMVIPLAIGLIGRDGRDLPLDLADRRAIAGDVIALAEPAATLLFRGIEAPPVLSLNRRFSAPIKLTINLSPDDLRFLAAHDGDAFNRWQAVQTLATRLLVDNVAALRAGATPRQDAGVLDALAAVLADGTLAEDFVALTLTLPSEADIAREIGREIDPDAIFAARSTLRRAAGERLAAALADRYRTLAAAGPYRPDAAGSSLRPAAATRLRLPPRNTATPTT
jgi:aminopeptidase N